MVLVGKPRIYGTRTQVPHKQGAGKPCRLVEKNPKNTCYPQLRWSHITPTNFPNVHYTCFPIPTIWCAFDINWDMHYLIPSSQTNPHVTLHQTSITMVAYNANFFAICALHLFSSFLQIIAPFHQTNDHLHWIDPISSKTGPRPIWH